MTLRDELLAEGKSAYADAQRGYHIDSEADEEDFTKGVAAVVDVVLAAGERAMWCRKQDSLWFTRHMGGCDHDDQCEEVVVLAGVSLREGEQGDG